MRHFRKISRQPALLGLTKVHNPKREKALVPAWDQRFFYMVCNFTDLRKTTLLYGFFIMPLVSCYGFTLSALLACLACIFFIANLAIG